MRKIAILPMLMLCYISSAQSDNSSDFGKNIVSVLPLYTYGTDNAYDLGVGLAYERFLSDLASLHIPLAVGFNHNMVQAGVGLKIYPGGHDGVIEYAVAPTFLFSSLSAQPYDNYSLFNELNYVYKEVDVAQFGFMLVNSLNIMVGSNIHLGVEAGIGINYFNHYKESDKYKGSDNPSISGNFGFELGYRF